MECNFNSGSRFVSKHLVYRAPVDLTVHVTLKILIRNWRTVSLEYDGSVLMTATGCRGRNAEACWGRRTSKVVRVRVPTR